MALVDRSSFTDRPFAPPLDIELDLPVPPSVNHIWKRTKAGKRAVYPSPDYERWKRDADGLIFAMAQFRGVKPLPAQFEALIVLCEKRCNLDLDNAPKAILDYAKNARLIVDDGKRYMRELRVTWGYAPHGCRLILRPREAAPCA